MKDQQSKPIRIAHVVGKVVLGGVDAMLMNYYRHIDRTKFQFDFFMDGLDQTPIDDEILALGGRIFKLPSYAENMGANLKRFREILVENRYKIVHSHLNTLSILWLREAKRAGVPIRIAHSHSTAHWGEGSRTWIKYLLRPFSRMYPTNFFACGVYAGRWLFGNGLFNAERVTVIPNAIELDRFKYSPDMRKKVRDTLGLQNKFVIGHVGRFMYQKNHAFLIKVFNEFYYRNNNAVLMLIGDGEIRSDFERMVRDLNLEEAVMFMGSRRDVHELYQAMDAFVLPSFYEGFPVVSLEAQAAGLPCIFSDQITDETMIVQKLCNKLPIKNDCIGLWCESLADAERQEISARIYNKALDAFDITKTADNLYSSIKPFL